MTATRLFDRAVVRLWGEDVRGFLNGLVTNDVTGESQEWAALLTPQGKVLFDFIVWPEVVVGSPEIESLLLDCEASQADALIKRLSVYRLRRKIDIWLDIAKAVHWHPDDIGIYIGSALGGIAFGEEQHLSYVNNGLRGVHPMLALAVFGGASSSHIAIEIGISGPNIMAPPGPLNSIIPSGPGTLKLNRPPRRMTSLALPAVTCTSRKRPPE